jgi:hypothetical protein
MVVAPRPDAPYLYFEDSSLLGIVHTFEDVQTILTDWRAVQETFLKNNAPRFVLDTLKAWNLYTILLTPGLASDSSALSHVEEDFTATRKVARAGVVSLKHVVVALSPVLPFQRLVTVGVVETTKRLGDRLASIHPSLRDLSSAPPASLADALEAGQ